MLLHDKMVQEGHTLFRWRSYLPFLLLAYMAPTMIQYDYFLGSPTANLVWALFCFAVATAGFLVRCAVVGYSHDGASGRNTKEQVARALNTDGIYSLTRNPLYFGNFLMILGVILWVHDIWLLTIYLLAFYVYYERIIMTEESFLTEKFGDEYREWASRTPAFWPRLARPRTPALPFSLKRVLRKEPSSFLGLVVAFVLLDALSNLALYGSLHLAPLWAALLVIGVALFVILVAVKKSTKWLNTKR